ncbi:MAG: hypothetical protein DI598_19620 [Pseudopedobacter saltans]|uniref:Phosphatidic acid phosphatase type 2/haloperoxidase domain-containing protein n=1 Tax=Pseudopedobacter saltans TaxID=151895 RepID=A0A2W5EAB4_9SPHI|nr:MAG: hypothetical protein DI598_19620 [Pseudopedobacter saltans]
MNWKRFLIVGLVSVTGVVNAQEIDSTSQTKNSLDTVFTENKDSLSTIDSIQPIERIYLKGVGNTIGRFGDAVVYTWSSPLRWKKKDWITAGAVAGATALLFIADKPVNKFWKRQRNGPMKSIEDFGYHYGKPYAAIISMGGFYTVGLLFKSDWAKETAMILGSSYLSSGALQTIIKNGAGRARPGADVGNMHFKPFSKDANYHSFPSGHIQIAMTTATVLANRVKNPYLQTFFYATAATTFISRMQSNSHWISDLFLGGVTSWYMARTNVKRWKMTSHQAPFTDMLQKKPTITWNMGATDDGIGLVGRF